MAAGQKIRKKRLGSYPVVSVVFSTTLSMVVFGLFVVIIAFGSTFTQQLRENIEIQVFLEQDATTNKIRQIEGLLEGSTYRSQADNALTFTSRDDAAELLKEATGDDFVGFLDENPLRPVFSMKINEEYQTEAQLSTLKAELERVDGIYEVTYIQDLTEQINQNISRVALIVVSIAILLIIVVIVLINNTIRLALFSQRFLIRSMQLVGATKGFIRRPFLNRAFMQGLLAGILASGILFVILENAKNQVEELAGIFDYQLLAIIFTIILAVSAVLSVVSASQALNRYMKMSLDDLY